jgi:hypothetical protein
MFASFKLAVLNIGTHRSPFLYRVSLPLTGLRCSWMSPLSRRRPFYIAPRSSPVEGCDVSVTGSQVLTVVIELELSLTINSTQDK